MSRRSRTKSATSKKSIKGEKDDNSPPWPEWSDLFVNTTVWNPDDVPVPKKGGTLQTAKSKSGTANPPTSRLSTRKSVRASMTESESEEKCFDDGWSRRTDLFSGEDVAKWERPIRIESLKTTLVQDFSSTSLDLVTRNSSLMSNLLIKEIIESVSCLYVASLAYPFTAQFRSSTFNPPSESWKPWHHVYSRKAAGAGDGHFPSYNVYGRYIVRLYFLGKWRRIEVDDFFPVDFQGNLLLPVTCNNDIWFAVLSKALLRVMTVCNEGENITAITALTGWIKNTASFHGADLSEVWNVCCSHLLQKNELWPCSADDIHCTYYGGACLNDVRHLRESRVQKVLVFARITESIYNLEEVEPVRRKLLTYLYQVTQDWIKVEEYPSWKEYRWFDWAYRHNILKGKIGEVFKHVQVYSPVWKADSECRVFSELYIDPSIEETDITENFKEWEFEKFCKMVEQLELYYMPSQFEHSYRTETLDVLDSQGDDNTKSDQKGKTPVKKSMDHGKAKHIELPSRFTEESCTSFYLLTDSPYCKKIYVDMMFFDPHDDLPNGHLICEKFSWKDDTQADPVFFTKTSGSTCKVVTAGPGRHVFRIWCQLPRFYFFQIFSNTPFVLEHLETLQEIFQEDSVSYKLYGNQISERFRELVKTEYGSENHSQALRNFVESFYPTDLRQKSHLHQNLVYRIPFDKLLEESITEFILETELMNSFETVSHFIFKMRRLLLNPNFGEEILVEFEHTTAGEITSNVTTTTTTKSTPATKERKSAQQANTMYFDNPENNLKILKIIMSKEKSFLALYPFCFDDETKIIFHDYKGKAEAQSIHPFYIAARLLLNVHSSEFVPCGIYTFLQHDFSRVCVYDVATMNKVPVKFDRNSIWKLKRSEMGYVVLVLCFNQGPPTKSKVQELQWKLRVASFDENSLLHPCRVGQQACNFRPPVPQNSVENIRGYFIPNVCNVITKFLITLTHNDIVTLQLSVSCISAVVTVFVKGLNDSIVREAEGRGNLLMPSVVLDLKDAYEDTGKHYFQGEVLLLYSSWNLSEEEKKFVNNIKETYVTFSDIFHISKIKRKKSRQSVAAGVQSETDDSSAPTWTLTMMTEQGHRDKVTKLVPDTRIYDLFKATLNQPPTDQNRSKNGTDLRARFKGVIEELAAETDSSGEPKNFDNMTDYYQSLIDKYSDTVH